MQIVPLQVVPLPQASAPAVKQRTSQIGHRGGRRRGSSSLNTPVAEASPSATIA